MADEKLEELLNKFPHIKENGLSRNTLNKRTNNLIKKEIQCGISRVEAEQEALLNLTDLDTLSSQLKNLKETDYSKYNDFFAKVFDSKLVNELKLKLSQIDEIHLNCHLGDILASPTNSSDLIVHDFMSRNIEDLHSTVEKIDDVLKVTQSLHKLVGIFKNKTLLFLLKDFTNFLTIRSQSDDVYTNKVPSYCMLDVTAVSGDLLLTHSKLKRVQADLRSDDITASSTSTDVFHINTRSGVLTSGHVCTEEEISYHTSSGNIGLESISTKDLLIDAKGRKIIINDLNSERMDLVTDTGNMSLNKVSGSGDIKSGIGKISLSIVGKSNFSFSIANKVGSIRVNVPRKELFKFKISTKKIGPIDLPLDPIIYGNNEYDRIEGYVGNENSSNSLTITNETGKISTKSEN